MNKEKRSNTIDLSAKNNSKISDFQDLEHLDGLAISVVNAKLYNPPRDDVVLFYFRNGANFASVYTQSTIVSENIKWNREIKNKKIHARDIKSFVKKFIQFPVSKYMMEHKDVDTVGVKIKNKSICCL